MRLSGLASFSLLFLSHLCVSCTKMTAEDRNLYTCCLQAKPFYFPVTMYQKQVRSLISSEPAHSRWSAMSHVHPCSEWDRGRASWLTVPPDQIEVLGLSQKMQPIGQRHVQNTIIIIFHFRWVEYGKSNMRAKHLWEKGRVWLGCKQR